MNSIRYFGGLFVSVTIVLSSVGNLYAREPLYEGLGVLFAHGCDQVAPIAELREAIKLEDALRYDEPPGWLIPVRHSLGAVLMKAGRFAEAEQVYRDDLARLPENGWSLYGLAESLREQKKNTDETTAVKSRFRKCWAKADTKITTSCLCQAAK